MATASNDVLKPDHGSAGPRHPLFTEEHDQLRESIRRSQLVLVAIHHAFDLYRDSAMISLMLGEHIEIFEHVLAGRKA